MPAPLRTFNLGDGRGGGKVKGEGDTWEKSVYPCDDKGGLSRMCVKKCAAELFSSSCLNGGWHTPSRPKACI